MDKSHDKPRDLCRFGHLAAALLTPALLFSCQKPSDTKLSENADKHVLAAAEPTSSVPLCSLSEGSELEAILAFQDAAKDGWNTEVANDQVSGQLKKLATLVFSSVPLEESRDSPKWAAVLDEAANLQALVPLATDTVFADQSISVRRAAAAEEVEFDHDDRDPLQVLGELRELFSDPAHVHTKFKVVRVQLDGESIDTDVYFLADGSSAAGFTQVNATWHIGWVTQPNGLPRLSKLSISDYEQVVTKKKIFEDCTASVLGQNDSFAGQMLRSTNYWRANLQGALGVDLFGHQGMAIGDVNGDGLDDLYVCQPGGLPNRLYVQQADGTALDRSAEAHLDLLDRSRSALFLDLDNDGDQDLSVMTDTRLLFLKNDGSGRFEPVGDTYVGTAVSLAAADYDNDGDLDVYVCGYSAPRGGEGAPTPYHDANNGYRNSLLRNDGQLQFTEVTTDVGLNANNLPLYPFRILG